MFFGSSGGGFYIGQQIGAYNMMKIKLKMRVSGMFKLQRNPFVSQERRFDGTGGQVVRLSYTHTIISHH